MLATFAIIANIALYYIIYSIFYPLGEQII